MATTDEFDPRDQVARFIAALVRDTGRVARAGFSKQLEAGSLASAEQAHLRRVLEACGGNKSEAARILQIDRRSLQRKLSRLDRPTKKPRRGRARR